MGSTFTRITKKKGFKRGTFGRALGERVYMQFVPGHVIDVATSIDSAVTAKTKNLRDINCIIAKSHMTRTLGSKATTTTKYYPLLRGMVDTPTKGDPVLLCTFGGVNYYLGPINTINNPNFNPDHLFKPEVDLSKGKVLGKGAFGEVLKC